MNAMRAGSRFRRAELPAGPPPATSTSALVIFAFVAALWAQGCAALRAGQGATESATAHGGDAGPQSPASAAPQPQPPAESSQGSAAAPARPDEDAIREASRSDLAQTRRYVSARAYQHYLVALLARQRDDFAQAATELREALLYDPESPHLHTLLADSLVRQGRAADAEEELREALAHEPQFAPARVLLGRIAAARDQQAEARGQFRAAIDALPEDPDAYRELIHLEAARGEAVAAASVAQQMEAATQRLLRAAAADERSQVDALGLVADAEGRLLTSDGELAFRAQRMRESCAEAWAEVARAFAQKHDEAAAGEAFARASALDGANPEVIASQAQYFESRRRFDEARKAELKLLAMRPDGPEILASLTRLAVEEGDFDSAAAHVRKLISLAEGEDPAPADRHDDAGTGAGAAAGADPTAGGARLEDLRELAGALLRAGIPLLGARRSGEALAAFEAALRLFPAHPELQFYRALALVRRGRAKEALALFDRLAQEAPAQGPQASRRRAKATRSFLELEPRALALDARVQAALTRLRTGESAEAVRSLRALFDQHPRDGGVALGLLEALEQAGGGASEAVQLFETAARAHPREPALLYALGTAQDRAGSKVEALRTMRALLVLAPDDPSALNYVGYSLAEAGGKDALAEAEALLSRAVELRPDDGAIADSYGYCLLRRGDAARALPELSRADKLNPGDPVILNHLGDALLAAGRRDEARETFLRALDRLGRPAGAHGPRAARKAAQNGRPAPSAPALSADSATAPDDADERTPDPSDDRVRDELEAKLRSLTAR